MRLVLDSAMCTGHGRCYTVASALFVDDEFGHGAVVGTGEVDESTRELAQRAVVACPERAISLLDD